MENSRHFAASWSHSPSAWNRAIAAALVASLTAPVIAVVPARGQEAKQEAKQEPNPADITPPWGTFPKAGAGIELAGELVAVDHINRRFA